MVSQNLRLFVIVSYHHWMMFSASFCPRSSVHIEGTGMTAMALTCVLQHFDVPFSSSSRSFLALREGGIQLAPNGVALLEKIEMDGVLEKWGLKPESLNLIDGVKGDCLLKISLQNLGKHPYLLLGRETLFNALQHKINTEKQQKTQERQTILAVCHSLEEHGALSKNVGQFTRIGWKNPSHAPCTVSVVMLPKRHAVCYPFLHKDGSIVWHGTLYEHACKNAWRQKEWRQVLMRCHLINESIEIKQYKHDQMALHKKPFPCHKNSSSSYQHTVLLGEARGHLPPFTAQGFSMALEDAFTFAATLKPFNHIHSFAQSHRMRLRRLGYVRLITTCAGFLFHGTHGLRFFHQLRMMPLRMMPRVIGYVIRRSLMLIYRGVKNSL